MGVEENATPFADLGHEGENETADRIGLDRVVNQIIAPINPIGLGRAQPYRKSQSYREMGLIQSYRITRPVLQDCVLWGYVKIR